MSEVSPKVTAQSAGTLIAAVIVTFIVTKVPGLRDLSEPTSALIVAVVATVVGWISGYVKSAVGWADRYVQDHQTL